MTDVEALVDDLIAGTPGSTALAVREARLRLELWSMLESQRDRTDRLDLITEAAQLLEELAISYGD